MIEQIQDTLTQVLRDVFDDDGIVATRELSAATVDGWDSLAHVRLLLTIERKFHITLAASEVGRLKTVGDLIDLIQCKVSSAGS